MRRCDYTVAVSLIVVVAFALACGGGGGGGGASTVEVTGTALNSWGYPVPGATVTIASDPVVVITASDGTFTADVLPGEHDITMAKDGTTFYEGTLTVEAGTPLVLGDLVPTTAYSPLATITVTPQDLDLSVDEGAVSVVTMYDTAWTEVDTDNAAPFTFEVEPGEAFVFVVDYANGQAVGAITPTVTGDLTQQVSVDTEVAMNMIVATENVPNDFTAANLTRTLDALLTDANTAVDNMNDFLSDRNTNRDADRITDAVRAITLDRLNQYSWLVTTDLGAAYIRAYGGGQGGMRMLADIVSDPQAPLNPHFTFTRYNSNAEFDLAMSDLGTERWDLLESDGILPHIVPGGRKMVFIGKNGSTNAGNYSVLGVYVKTLGSAADPVLLTPATLFCLTLSMSPDETQVVFSGRYVSLASSSDPTFGGPLNLFVINADGTGLTQITNDADVFPSYDGMIDGNLFPSWHPGGEEIIFSHSMFAASDAVAEDRLEKIAPDGTGRTVFFDVATYALPDAPQYSPDGRWILFDAIPDGGTDTELMMVIYNFDPDTNNVSYQVTSNTCEDSLPTWSYDGRFIIFSSDRGGEDGTLAGVNALNPFYVVDAYTFDDIEDMDDFALAGFYYRPRFTATEAVLGAVDGATTDSDGTVIIDAGSDARTWDDHSVNSYYREIIPAANSIGMNFNVPSWF